MPPIIGRTFHRLKMANTARLIQSRRAFIKSLSPALLIESPSIGSIESAKDQFPADAVRGFGEIGRYPNRVSCPRTR